MEIVTHTLHTGRFGPATVIVPTEWPMNYGFILKIGDPTSNPLVRVQSRCAYGEVFGSEHCDCGSQLEMSCQMIREAHGYIFYLEQEGRSAGSTVKARAYMASELEGIDSFQYFESVNLPPDLRNYDAVAYALKGLNISSVRLLTNNPAKVAALEKEGITVTQVPLLAEVSEVSKHYIYAKRSRGHTL